MERIRERLEAHQEASERRLSNLESGRASDWEALLRIDEEYGDVTDGECLSEAVRSRDEATGDDRRETWRRLAAALETALLTARTRRATGERARRAAAGAGPDELDDLGHEILERASAARRDLGHPTLAARVTSAHRALDLDLWAGHADAILAATESSHHDRVGATLTAARVEKRSATEANLIHIDDPPALAALFPAKRLDEAIAFSVDGLGVALDRLGLVLDERPSPGRVAGSRLRAPRVPGEIHLLTIARDGAAAYRERLALTGAALHLAHAAATTPVERRRLGDPGLAELWRHLLGDLLGDPTWAAHGPAQRGGDAYLRALGLARLVELRRVAALARWECALATGEGTPNLRDLLAARADELTRALGVRHADRGTLPPSIDLDAVHRLRGAIAADRLAASLRHEFGAEFWRSRGAGDLLKELWHTAFTYTVEELAGELDLDLDPAPLVAELVR